MALKYSEMPDGDLMQRVAEYDSRALEAIYNRYSPLLYTIVKKIVGDKETAEEVLTEVFVIIWRKMSYYNSKNANAYCWLVTLTRNKAVDHMRRKRFSEQMPPYDDVYENTYVVPRLSPQIDDLDLHTALEIKKNIENALNKLTDAQQYVIYLAFYEGLTNKEIAGRLKIPFQTVASKINVAMTNLRDNLLRGGE